MVVLEVGLGGRLDATNVVHARAVRDHADRFRSRSLSGQEPGIDRRREGGHPEGRRSGGLFAPAARGRRRCWTGAPRSFRIPVARTDALDHRRPGAGRARQPLPALGRTRSAHRLPARRRAPGGECRHRRRRADAPGRLRSAIEEGIAQTHWPGRLERVSEQPEIILDGAHNPAGARALAAYIERFYAGRRVRLIYGAMRDKAVDEIGGILFPLRAAGDRHRAAPGPRPVARGHARESPTIPTCGRPPDSARGAGDGPGRFARTTSSSSPGRCSWWRRRAPCLSVMIGAKR